jgi:nucleotide-binding universal stress UspA family protein
MFETVIVPLDGSAHAEFALPYGRDEAARHGARIVLVHVLPRPELPPTPLVHGGPRPRTATWPAAELEERERGGRAYLDGVSERFALPENAGAVIAVGDPTCRLLEEAGKYARPLIVMTTGDATAANRPPLSEVARRVMVAGNVPILALREPAPQTRQLAARSAAPVRRLSVVPS